MFCCDIMPHAAEGEDSPVLRHCDGHTRRGVHDESSTVHLGDSMHLFSVMATSMPNLPDVLNSSLCHSLRGVGCDMLTEF